MLNAVITGAAGGLGIHLVEKYLKEEYRVHAFVRTQRPALGELQERYGDQLSVYIADVGSTESVERAAAEVAKKTDHIDVLVNCAAVLPRDHLLPFEEISIDAILNTLNINSLGFLRVVQKCYGLLKKGREPIVVNISSAGASFQHIIEWDDRLEYPYAYCMSKAAMNMGSAILQRRSNLDGIRVICVHPGLLDTWMNAGNPFGEELIPPAESAGMIYELAQRERAKDTRNLFFNYDGEVFPY